MLTLRACAFFLLAATVILLAIVLMPRATAEDLPPLEVLTPRDRLHTNNSTLVVTGITVPNATVCIAVESRHTNRSFNGSAKEDGTFSVAVKLSDIIQNVIITVTDAQNRSSTVIREVTYDNDPPRFKVMHPLSSPWYTNQMTIVIGVENVGSPDVMIYVNGVDIAGSHHMDVNLSEGENRIEVRAEDRAGNEAVEWVVVIVDRTPPTLSLVFPSGNELVTNTTNITISGNVSGASMVHVNLDGSPRTVNLTSGDWLAGGTWVCPVDLGTTDGTWPAVVKATDAVGNVAQLGINVTLDRTPPDISIRLASSSRVPRVQINGLTEEGVDEVLIDGDTFSVVNGLFSTVIMPLEHGWNRIVIRLHDPAGNWATGVAEVFYSGRPPSLRLDDPVRMGDMRARIRGSTDWYVDHVLVNGRPFHVVNGSFDVVLNLTRGNNEFEVSVEDPAGVGADERVEVGNRIPVPGVPALAIAMVLVAALGRMRRGMT